mgnify:CR=1 FL=1
MCYSQNQIIKDHLTLQENLYLQTGELLTTPIGQYGKKLYFGHTNDNTDPIWMARYNTLQYYSELRVNIGDEWGDKFCVGFHHFEGRPWKNILLVNTAGMVGINTDNPQSELDVRGKIIADAVEIKVNKGADFVFKHDYNLKPLSEVESFVKENQHLPDIPSEKEMQEKGLNVNDMQIKLLQKIEELTLYIIEQDKKIQNLQSKLENKE